MPIDPVQGPSVPAYLRDHHERIRKIEAKSASVEWEDDGDPGSLTIPPLRFINLYFLNSDSYINSAENVIQVGADTANWYSNDVPATAGYGDFDGSAMASDDFTGDHFSHESGDNQNVFTIQGAGIYLLSHQLTITDVTSAAEYYIQIIPSTAAVDDSDPLDPLPEELIRQVNVSGGTTFGYSNVNSTLLMTSAASTYVYYSLIVNSPTSPRTLNMQGRFRCVRLQPTLSE